MNLGIVKREVDNGEFNPSTIFSDKSVDIVTEAWKALGAQGTQYHYPKALVKLKLKTSWTIAEHHQATNEMTNQ